MERNSCFRADSAERSSDSAGRDVAIAYAAPRPVRPSVRGAPRRCRIQAWVGGADNRHWAVLSGATDHIGRQVAVRLARAGYELVLLARNPAKASAAEVQLVSPGREVAVVACALTRRRRVAS